MIKTLLMSILLFGLTSMALTQDYTSNCLAADEDQSEQSLYAGQYKGTWTGKSLLYGEQEGTWILKIDANGRITGKEVNDIGTNSRAKRFRQRRW